MTDLSPELPPMGADLQTVAPSPLVQETSSVVQPESALVSSGTNVPTLDKNLRAISAVEARWRLPEVPDMVRLDLASLPGVTPETLSSFLQGLDRDLTDVNEDPAATRRIRSQLPDGTENRSAFDDARVFFAGMTGSLPPEDPDAEAAIKFKQRAINAGLLDENTVLDNRWSPELESVRRELFFTDLNDMYRGDRPSAVPITGEGGLVEKIAEWTQPTGLLAAATDLGLFWDVGEISNQFSSWGDKWREVGNSKNPLSFAKNLVDAMLGPVDDIVLPALNVALLFTGVGSVAQGARITAVGANAVRAGRFRSAVDRAGDFYRPTPMNKLTKPSWTAEKLMDEKRGKLSQFAGEGLAAWRAFPVVARTKQVLQPGIRAGMMANAQSLVPGYEGGVSLRDMAPGLGEAADELKRIGYENLAFTPLELAFAPYNYFTPGTFFRSAEQGASTLNVFTRLGKGSSQSLGGNLGRAVVGGAVGAATGAIAGEDLGDVGFGAAVGGAAFAALPHVGRIVSKNDLTSGLFASSAAGLAASGATALTDTDVDPWTAFGLGFGLAGGVTLLSKNSSFAFLPDPGKAVGFLGRGMSKFNFKSFGDDQANTMAFMNAIRRRHTNDPDLLKRFDGITSDRGAQQAIADEFYFGGLPADMRPAPRRFTDDEMDKVYAAEAYYTLAAAIRSASQMFENRDVQLRYANKLKNQVRRIDEERPIAVLRDEYARMRALESPNYQSAYDEVIEKMDDAALLVQIRLHNESSDLYLRQLLSPENIPDYMKFQRAQGLEGNGWLSPDLSVPERTGILEGYLVENLNTFGNWDQFVRQSQMVESWASDGVLLNAKMMPGKTPYGDDFSLYRAPKDTISESAKAVDNEILDLMMTNPDLAERLGAHGRVSPLARSSLQGRFTPARLETKTKEDLGTLRASLKDLLRAERKILQHAGRGRLAKVESALAGRDIETIGAAELGRILKAADITSGDDIKYLVKFAKQNKIPFSELQVRVNQLIDEKLASVDWTAHRLNPHLMSKPDANGNRVPLKGREALQARVRELNNEMKYTASGVDTDELVAGVRRTHGEKAADDLAEQLAAMKEDGYKLVYGVEFQSPTDILNRFEPFADLSAREMNAATFGNFFGRRQPPAARAAQERRERLALSAALRDQGVMDVLPDDDKITWMLQDLRRILQSGQDDLMNKMEDFHHMTFWERKQIGLQSATHPYRVEDLVKQKDATLNRLVKEFGWSENESKAIYSALRKFRNAETRDLGLYALEAKLRQSSLAVGGLKFMAGSKYHQSLINREIVGAGVGAFSGQALAGALTDPGADEDQAWAAKATGLLGGAVAGVFGFKGGGNLAVKSLGGYQKALQRAEMNRVLHLGDHYARYRDTLRFSLSPIFDLSRYTEGMMLGQAAAPLRKADGSRLALPFDMSPKGVRRRMRKAGLNADETFKQRMKEFTAASKGDFDYEALDSFGKWFQSIGIMGFNPTTWMAGAFTELRLAGMSSKEAYENARRMYTYAIGGRSAAELSVNFVFFPFSFQKKAFGHLAKWMNDDVGRSILIHDGLKAYEALSEKHNLDEFWRDHVPFMRQMQRLNLFAYGLSAGRFGGINAAALETGGKALMAGVDDVTALPSMALFQPWVGKIQDQQDALNIKRLISTTAPAINDITWMVQELKETSNVVFSESHKMSRGQVTAGYDEWNGYRDQLSQDLEAGGWRWSDLFNSPYLEEARIAYEFKRSELISKYPAWDEARRESIFNAQMLEMDRREAMSRYLSGEGTDTDRMLAEMQDEVDRAQAELEFQGVYLKGRDGWMDAPPWAWDYIKGKATQMAENDPRFRSVWERFFQREFGPITARI
jgi:hypothetical protein